MGKTKAIIFIAMSSYPQSRSFLLHLLMILEWVLLGIVAISQIIVVFFTTLPNLLIVNIFGLGLFALLGRMKPQQYLSKLIYTLIEFVLIFCLIFFGNLVLPTILFVILVIRNGMLWEKPYRGLVTGFAFVGCIIGLSYNLFSQFRPFNIPSDQIGVVWISVFFSIGLIILFLHLLVDAALKERQRQEELSATNARLREYALRIEDLATVQERNRIARDIHDSLGHSLTVFGIHLEGALRLMRSHPDKAEELLREIKQLNTRTLQEVRQSITVLRSDPLQKKSLSEAITDLMTEFYKSTGVLPTFDNQLKSLLSHEVDVVIYRIVQESLTNIRKYAVATEVKISLIQSTTDLKITIVDNGKGFDLTQNTTGFGLQGMRERTLALKGKLEIITAPNQGCRVMAKIPLSGIN
ncbi:sensor histidine kinase [Cyanobacterium aponinum AL20118]|uniref:histidine kinase n=1 Tax=Cyanobacterium aponinum AL20115 TaxID=3090662 RepID=A0AAF0Z8W0_9CHRO|nr:sensor histidine kinase [Cyanobacterium aponinum]WPF87543.1 sensor histidine kinase [Cyanobacterium aponinum AL20115]